MTNVATHSKSNQAKQKLSAHVALQPAYPAAKKDTNQSIATWWKHGYYTIKKRKKTWSGSGKKRSRAPAAKSRSRRTKGVTTSTAPNVTTTFAGNACSLWKSTMTFLNAIQCSNRVQSILSRHTTWIGMKATTFQSGTLLGSCKRSNKLRGSWLCCGGTTRRKLSFVWRLANGWFSHTLFSSGPMHMRITVWTLLFLCMLIWWLLIIKVRVGAPHLEAGITAEVWIRANAPKNLLWLTALPYRDSRIIRLWSSWICIV